MYMSNSMSLKLCPTLKVTFNLLLLSLCLASCRTQSINTDNAPRAIPVKPVVQKLDKRIHRVSEQAEDIERQAEAANAQGLTPNSEQGRKLVDTAKGLRKELEEAKSEITVIGERTDAIVLERDHFAKTADDNVKALQKMDKDLAVVESKRKTWMWYGLSVSLIVLLFLLFKLAKLYNYSLNPLALLKR